MARALAGLDREAIADERWFGAKGRTIGSIELEDAFVLDAAASHVLAIARFGLDDGSWQLVRFSGTEPLVRVYAEASSAELRDEILNEGAALVRGESAPA